MKRRARRKVEVGLLGATGMVGQQFVSLLAGHPWFRLCWLAASERSSGKRYEEIPWRLSAPMPEEAARLAIETPELGRAPRVVFSALDACVAGEIEAEFAATGHVVVSNARNHRMDSLVPLLIPEVNAEHLGILPAQRKAKAWDGALVTNPNCATIFLAMALAALREFEPKRVLVTTMQALSGAGYPGVASLDAQGNVIPFIHGEEEKIEIETRKVLGEITNAAFAPASIAISAQATRVPVMNGHTEAVSAEFGERVATEEIREAFRKFSGKPQELGLPSAPKNAIVVGDLADRPQPRLDAERFGGMAVQVGRLRTCPVLGHKFVLLGHNTIRGAAGAAILNAELMHAEGLIQ
ncbi:MAG TPA: aspartate-semialdehyde dehydrogenase [Candidatus Acidoferrales bacterium]|nr:aspartate-semialdehyde dehydrogenase [Candidatus Acidoferrales bacterium]